MGIEPEMRVHKLIWETIVRGLGIIKGGLNGIFICLFNLMTKTEATESGFNHW